MMDTETLAKTICKLSAVEIRFLANLVDSSEHLNDKVMLVCFSTSSNYAVREAADTGLDAEENEPGTGRKMALADFLASIDPELE